MDVKDLKQLIKMITETDITEFSMDTAEEKIVIKRGAKTEFVQMTAPVQTCAVPVAPQAVTASAAAPVAVEAGETINSPIVGTFYRAASPEAAPFVEAGQVVEKGQVLCLVEAMKLFNEIEAEFRCRIVRICQENAQPVEFGQPLFVVERV